MRFDDSATGATNVTLTTTLSPAGVTVSNTAATATANYNFSSSGKLSGTIGLTKQGSGTLTLAKTGGDNFSGGITVSGGTLLLDNASSAISGGVNIPSGAALQVGNNDANGTLPSGSVADNGSLIFSQTQNATVGVGISGTGTVTKNSSGTLTLGVNSPFTGGATVNSGILQVRGNGGNTSLGGGDVTVNAGGTLIGTNSDAFGYAGSGHTNPANIYIGGGVVSDLAAPSYRVTMPNLIFTGGMLTDDPANTGDASGNYSFNGNGSVVTITTLASATTAQIGASAISPQQNLTFNVASGTTPSGIDLLISSTIKTYTTTARTVTKSGPGVLALSGADTYIGNTVVSNGTLALIGSGSLASPQIALTNNAIFDVSQLTSTFTLNSFQTLGGVGVVTGNVATVNSSLIDAGLYGGQTFSFSNNLTLANGATNRFVLSTTTSGNNSLLTVAGTLDTSAGSGSGGVVILVNYTTLQNGTYKLITYGSWTGSLADLSLAGYIPGGRQTAALDSSISGEIDLVVSGAPGNMMWLGDGVNNLWDTNTTPNWSNTVSHVPDVYFDGDIVTFNDLGSQSPAVNLTGTLQPTSILVANNSGTYTFGDTNSLGKIAGATPLTKMGTGGLALTESGGDNFSGGITVGGGTLILSNNNVNITGGVTVTNGTVIMAHSGTISGGLNLNNGGSPVAQVIGTGTLNGGITAAGNLTISNSPTISGGLIVTNGTTLLDEDSTPTGNTVIAGGATVQVGNNDYSGLLPAGTLTMNGTLIFNQPNDNSLTKVISGAASGSLIKSNLNVLTLNSANTFTGAVTVAAGTLKAGNAAALGRTNLGTTISAGATLDVNGIVLGGEPVTVSGIGTTNNDGSTNGAINNTSATGAIPALNYITMTGNTVFGTTGGRWDLGAPAGPTGDPSTSQLSTGGNPYTLTKVGNQFFGLRAVTVDPQLGDVEVQAGTFNIEGNTTGLGNVNSNLFVRNGATLEFYNMTNQLNKQIQLDDGATVFSAAGSNVVIGPMTLNGSEILVTSNALVLNGALSGAGSFTKNGLNTLTLSSSANTYSGNTTINVGTLALVGSGVTLGGGTATLNSSVLDLSRETGAFTLTTNTLTMNNGSKLMGQQHGASQHRDVQHERFGAPASGDQWGSGGHRCHQSEFWRWLESGERHGAGPGHAPTVPVPADPIHEPKRFQHRRVQHPAGRTWIYWLHLQQCCQQFD